MSLLQHSSNSVSEKIIGAAIEVHRHLGPGLLESTYQACLCRELDLRGIPYRREVHLPLEYKGLELDKAYVIDLLVENSLIVETKAVEKLHPIHSAHLLTYMRLMGFSAGLLLNFNVEIMTQGIRRRLR